MTPARKMADGLMVASLAYVVWVVWQSFAMPQGVVLR